MTPYDVVRRGATLRDTLDVNVYTARQCARGAARQLDRVAGMQARSRRRGRRRPASTSLGQARGSGTLSVVPRGTAAVARAAGPPAGFRPGDQVSHDDPSPTWADVGLG